MSATTSERRKTRLARSAARLAVVQALYQMELTGHDVDSVAREFVMHRLAYPTEGLDLSGADPIFFEDLLSGVVKNQVEVDNAIAHALAQGWTLERLDSILRALLRAGTYEITLRLDVPPRAAIDEYVEIARDFFEGEETKFVNGVLDTIARAARPEDMRKDR